MDETLLHTEPLGTGQIVTKNYDHVLEIPDKYDNNVVPTIEVNTLKIQFTNLNRDSEFMSDHTAKNFSKE